MKLQSIIVLLFGLSLILSCNHINDRAAEVMKSEAGYENYGGDMDKAEAARPVSATQELHKDKESKIIRNGRMAFEVDDIETDFHQIKESVHGFNGHLDNESYSSYGQRNTYHLTIRVPNEKFDALVANLELEITKLTSKNISARDVTEEYHDLNIRLENNLAYLKQYKTILAKATSIKDILEVQDKIRRLEEEIDSKKGRIKYLDDKINYSTLEVELSELTTGTTQHNGFFKRLVNAFKSGVDVFLSFILWLVELWPFLLLFMLIYLTRGNWSWIFRRKSKT